MTHKLLINAGGNLLLNVGGGSEMLLNEIPPTPTSTALERRPSIAYKPSEGDIGSVVDLLILRAQSEPANLLILRGQSDGNLQVRSQNVARVRSVAMKRPAGRAHLPVSVD